MAACSTCSTGPCLPIAQIVQANLRQIGLDMDIKPFPRAVQFSKTGTRGEPFDLTLEGWHMDYFDPYDFIFLLDGTTIRPANNVNFSYFNSSAYNRRSPRRPPSSGRLVTGLSETSTSTSRGMLRLWRSSATTLVCCSRAERATSSPTRCMRSTWRQSLSSRWQSLVRKHPWGVGTAGAPLCFRGVS